MKRGMCLCSVVIMVVVFTACGSGENRKSKTQAAHVKGQEAVSLAVNGNANENGAFAEYENPAYEYETDVIRYGEAEGKFSFRKDVEKTKTDYAVYCFETSVSIQERQACITATDRALSCIGGTLPELEIAVFADETLDGIVVSGSRLYTPVRQWNSVEYLADVLLAAYGEWGNYGLAYGYADYLCRKAGMGDGETALYDRTDGGFLPMSGPEPYDLNLLCFDENFVSPEDVEAAKNNACYFVGGYLSAHSEEDFLKLLSDSGTTEGVRRANEALEAFYAENGADCDLTEIRYRYGGVTFDYAAACEYACFCLEKDWQDLYWEVNAKVSENFLHENYSEVKAFFECNARQMGQYQEFFGFDSYNNDLLVILTNDFSKISTSNGRYYTWSHTIYLGAVMSLMHEYIHSVMCGRCDFESLWKREGSARFFSNKYNEYFYSIADFYYMDERIWMQEFLDSLGRPLDLKKDIRTMVDMWVYICGEKDPDMSYDSASSFIGYLTDQYGEQAVIQYICSDDGYSTEWGKSYEELVKDWNDYIEENYSWYGAE